MKAKRQLLGLLVLLPWLMAAPVNQAQDAVLNDTALYEVQLPVVTNGGGGILQPIVPDTTEVLTEQSTDKLLEVAPDMSTFRFDGTNSELGQVEQGDIIVGSASSITPGGFLRRVNEVKIVADDTVLFTEPATLEDTVQQGEFHISKQFIPAEIHEAWLADGVTLLNPRSAISTQGFLFKVENVVLFDEDGNPATVSDQIRADGSFEVSPGIDFGIEVIDWKLNKLEFILSSQETAQLEIASSIQLADLDRRVQIAEIDLGTIVAWIGAVPVVITVDMPIFVGLEGDITLAASLGQVTQVATFDAGVRFENSDWDQIGDLDNSFTYAPPEVKVEANFKPYLDPPIQLRLYGVVGPYVAARPNFHVEATYPFGSALSVKLFAGLEIPVGVEMEVLGHSLAKYEGIAINYRKLLWESGGPFPPSEPHPPNGSIDASTSPRLSWSGGDPQNKPVRYDVYLEDKAGTPGVQVCDNIVNRYCDLHGLAPLTTYYWQVVSRNSDGQEETGPIWTFTTDSLVNIPPNAPSNPTPINGEGNQNTDVKLRWSGWDDDGDSLTFDVYFESGDIEPDILICDNVVNTTCDPGLLIPGTTYYWQVIVSDSHGSSTEGPVWSFRTYDPPVASESQNVTSLGHFGGSLSHARTVGNVAYVAVGSHLAVLDISDPREPKLIGRSKSLFSDIVDIEIAGKYAYVALNLGYGIQILDISNPTGPVVTGYFPVPAHVLEVGGDRLYAGTNKGLYILSIANPNVPVQLSSIPTHVWDVKISGNIAYVNQMLGYENHQLTVLDVSIPSHPVKIGNLDWTGHMFVMDTGKIYAIGRFKIYVVDVSRPASPVILSTVDAYLPGSIIYHQEKIYVGGSSYQASVFDVSNPENIVPESYYLASWPLYVSNDILYAAKHDGLDITSLSDPALPQSIGHWSEGSVSSIAFASEYAYVAGLAGLQTMNTSNPALVSSVYLSEEDSIAFGVVVHGSRAYVSSCSNYIPGGFACNRTLDILDITNPISHTLLGRHSGWADQTVALFKDHIVGVSNNGLVLYDVSDPSQLVTRGRLSICSSSNNRVADLVIYDSYAFVSCTLEPGLNIVDLSNPDEPIVSGQYDAAGGGFEQLALSNNKLYSGRSNGDLVVLDLSNPLQPLEVGRLSAPGAFDVGDLSVEFPLAYVLDTQFTAMRVLDVNDPGNIQQLGYFRTPAVDGKILVNDGKAFILSHLGVDILQYTPGPANAPQGQ